jgi:predicted  nucleic acid-binding Zn-ribbon protein
MVRKIVLAVLLLFVVGCAVLQNIYINNTTEELTAGLEKVRTALEEDDLQAAAAAADVFNTEWEEKKASFEAFFEHKEVDSISSSAKTLQSYCHTGQKEEALAHVAASIFYVEHIRDIDKLGWENVF